MEDLTNWEILRKDRAKGKIVGDEGWEEVKEVECCKFDPSSRYYDAGGIEVQDIIRSKLTPEQYEGFCLGNIIKYSCRANFKGSYERDIQKVGFYQKFLMETPTRGNEK